MIRQAQPVSPGMHAAVQHVEAAHVDAIQAQQRQPGRKTARQLAAMQVEHIVYMQLAGQCLARLIAPVIEIARDDQRRITGGISLRTYSISALVCARRPLANKPKWTHRQ